LLPFPKQFKEGVRKFWKDTIFIKLTFFMVNFKPNRYAINKKYVMQYKSLNYSVNVILKFIFPCSAYQDIISIILFFLISLFLKLRLLLKLLIFNIPLHSYNAATPIFAFSKFAAAPEITYYCCHSYINFHRQYRRRLVLINLRFLLHQLHSSVKALPHDPFIIHDFRFLLYRKSHITLKNKRLWRLILYIGFLTFPRVFKF